MGNSTVTSVAITLVLVFAAFSGIFLFMNGLAEKQGVEYTNEDVQAAYNKVETAQSDMDSYVSEIKSSGENISSSQNDFFTWNTFKGLGSAVKLSFNFVGLSTSAAGAVLSPADEFLPSWVSVLLIIAIIIIVVFIILAALTGGNSKI